MPGTQQPEKPCQQQVASPEDQDQQTEKLLCPPRRQTVQLLTEGEKGEQKDRGWGGTLNIKPETGQLT